MKFYRVKLAIFALSLGFTTQNMAQTVNSALDKQYRQARSQYDRGNFQNAADLYVELISKEPSSFLYNYELGLLYFYELNDKKKSIPFLQTAIDNMQDTTIDLFNYLGQAYQANLEYDKAIEMFQSYSAIPPKPGVIKISMKRYIQQCMDEKEKIAALKEQRSTVSESGIQVLNAGPIVNSEFGDIAPRYLNTNKLIITSAREFDYQFDVYVNKPYIVSKGPNGLFSEISRMSRTEYKELVFDPEWHLIVTGFTPDLSKVLYTYEELIYFREGPAENKVDPIKLPKEVNMAKQHSSATISPDGLRMVFSLFDRKLKCWDLYISTRSGDGAWRKAEKLGVLSSTKDERYPFFSGDGYTLYFSSTGHNTSGGYDIFKSTLQPNNEWSAPEKLPAPINSPDNDIWFSVSPDGKKGYFSSDRPGGFGQLDIYEVNF
jgi:tetratricopeptide (TPR) repeat protein